jgi:hypothetical protein
MDTPTARTLPDFLQVLEGAAPFLAVDPLGIPNVKLLHIDGLDSQIFQAGFR